MSQVVAKMWHFISSSAFAKI